MELKTVKEAIRESDRDTVEEVLKNFSEEVLEAAIDLGINPADIEEAYSGEYKSDVEFAQETAESLGAIDKNATWPQTCVDWNYAARELMYDYSESNGHYFRNI